VGPGGAKKAGRNKRNLFHNEKKLMRKQKKFSVIGKQREKKLSCGNSVAANQRETGNNDS
jgi:hypothetical protein